MSTNIVYRSDRELASSPSGLQASPSSPGNGKAARGRGRGRSRGRGSVRITADHSQLAQSQHDSIELHTSSAAALASDSSMQSVAQAAVKAEHDAADAAVPKAETDTTDPAAHEATALGADAHEVSGVKQEHMDQAAAAPDTGPRHGLLMDTSGNMQHAVNKFATESAALEPAALLAEEDDYDADD